MPQFNVYPLVVSSTAATGSEALSVLFESWLYLPSGFKFTIGAQTIFVAGNTLLSAENPAQIPIFKLSAPIVANTAITVERDDNARIRKHLGLNFSLRSVVESQMNLVGSSGDVVGEIQNALAELDALDLALADFSQDQNTTLIKAGSLEWSVGGKTMNVQNRQAKLKSELASYLDLCGSGGGNAALLRG